MSLDYTPLPMKSPFASRGPVPTPLEAIGSELPSRNTGPSRVLAGHIGAVHSVAFSPDGQELASASEDGTVGVWDVASGDMTAVLRGHERRVVSVAYSPRGLFIASGSDDCTVRLWLAPSRALYATLSCDGDRVSSVAFSSDGGVVVGATHNGYVQLWDMAGTCVGRWQVSTGILNGITHIQFTRWGQLFVCCRDKRIQIVSAYTGAVLTERQRADGCISSMAWRPDGLEFVTACQNRVQRWDTRLCSLEVELHGHAALVTSVSYSSDGTYVASGSLDHTVLVWNVRKCVPVATLKTGAVTSCAFSPVSDSLIIGLFDGTMRYLDDVRTITSASANTDCLDLRLPEGMGLNLAMQATRDCVLEDDACNPGESPAAGCDSELNMAREDLASPEEDLPDISVHAQLHPHRKACIIHKVLRFARDSFSSSRNQCKEPQWIDVLGQKADFTSQSPKDDDDHSIASAYSEKSPGTMTSKSDSDGSTIVEPSLPPYSNNTSFDALPLISSKKHACAAESYPAERVSHNKPSASGPFGIGRSEVPVSSYSSLHGEKNESIPSPDLCVSTRRHSHISYGYIQC
ncbi:hypothetical protein CERSUDRAFT_127214 [Gelatoporia subvermispora B]|uniref:Uncharacterized protein n=1 Tax=Ceriporiopsis subvermispora (strain B) TaxID=914234 RepID=M2P8W2_CERS8|nr:hypothetical protein CERSUDRAFT_127214 [Gelatoporia subvermispora B]